ncbi:hypothetical protein SLEP1_g22729 [Rubroshorea leprosula]|uniref:Uncharacterized protein n=1 Tax=Rubroshorea leprosula TaxID=152421 RepID=A0AAV5JM41_9ROSI|nr:hypothetical protein SLEP1_g22729 [Rubroshorea leprosula]
MKWCKTQTIPFRVVEHLGGYMPPVLCYSVLCHKRRSC